MYWPNPSSRKDLLLTVGNAMSQQPPVVSSFRICISCREPPHPRSHLFMVACIWWLSEADQPSGTYAGHCWAFLTPELPDRLAEALSNLRLNPLLPLPNHVSSFLLQGLIPNKHLHSKLHLCLPPRNPPCNCELNGLSDWDFTASQLHCPRIELSLPPSSD